MPQVVRVGKFIIVIYTNDHAPAHVHVQFDDCEVRVAIAPGAVVLLSKKGRPRQKDVKNAVVAVAENLEACLAKWKEIHG